MKERGMIFNGEMVRSILDGRKTQTRRVMAVQPEHSNLGLRYITESKNARDNGKYFWSQSDATGMKALSKPFACPYGNPGDRIWVRETWQAIHEYLNDDGYVDETRFARSIPKQEGRYWHSVFAADNWTNDREYRGFPWRPAIHMPRWASRIMLEIIDVRVERLNAISDADANAEGVQANEHSPARYVFGELWQSIYGADNSQSWQVNPWVWVIEFKRLEAAV